VARYTSMRPFALDIRRRRGWRFMLQLIPLALLSSTLLGTALLLPHIARMLQDLQVRAAVHAPCCTAYADMFGTCAPVLDETIHLVRQRSSARPDVAPLQTCPAAWLRSEGVDELSGVLPLLDAIRDDPALGDDVVGPLVALILPQTPFDPHLLPHLDLVDDGALGWRFRLAAANELHPHPDLERRAFLWRVLAPRHAELAACATSRHCEERRNARRVLRPHIDDAAALLEDRIDDVSWLEFTADDLQYEDQYPQFRCNQSWPVNPDLRHLRSDEYDLYRAARHVPEAMRLAVRRLRQRGEGAGRVLDLLDALLDDGGAECTLVLQHAEDKSGSCAMLDVVTAAGCEWPFDDDVCAPAWVRKLNRADLSRD